MICPHLKNMCIQTKTYGRQTKKICVQTNNYERLTKNICVQSQIIESPKFRWQDYDARIDGIGLSSKFRTKEYVSRFGFRVAQEVFLIGTTLSGFGSFHFVQICCFVGAWIFLGQLRCTVIILICEIS